MILRVLLVKHPQPLFDRVKSVRSMLEQPAEERVGLFHRGCQFRCSKKSVDRLRESTLSKGGDPQPEFDCRTLVEVFLSGEENLPGGIVVKVPQMEMPQVVVHGFLVRFDIHRQFEVAQPGFPLVRHRVCLAEQVVQCGRLAEFERFATHLGSSERHVGLHIEPHCTRIGLWTALSSAGELLFPTGGLAPVPVVRVKHRQRMLDERVILPVAHGFGGVSPGLPVQVEDPVRLGQTDPRPSLVRSLLERLSEILLGGPDVSLLEGQ